MNEVEEIKSHLILPHKFAVCKTIFLLDFILLPNIIEYTAWNTLNMELSKYVLNENLPPYI